MTTHVWEIRNPDGAAQGLEVARGRCDPYDVVLAHALPTEVDVLVTDGDDALIARGARLRGERPTPIARLTLSGGAVLRENIWPTESDLGSPVILPGGEIGLLTSWWNEDDGSAWRWTIELSNHRDVD